MMEKFKIRRLREKLKREKRETIFKLLEINRQLKALDRLEKDGV